MIHKGLILLTGLLMINCSGQDTEVIIINKTKKGGLFESNVNGKNLKFYNNNGSVKVDTTTFISFADFEGIKKGESPFDGVFALDFKLNDTGTLKFKEMTRRNLRKQICFVIGDKIIAAPIIPEIIPNGQIQMMIADKKGIELIAEYFKN